ncbi:unnamed protein product [Porites lobata]|uniref:Fibronectin type-II domain-containing protein n=1 Tax=Porites lobata TaxID=104759 RepID=A0ABN8NBI3_9CNID|nr:unnamed protein product [Porites lobata]
MAQYLKFAPWRPLRKDGLCIRIDIFENDNTSTPSSILRNGNYNVTFNYTSVRGNLTEPPLVNSNISWCPADDDLLRNPVLIVDLGEQFNISQVQVQGGVEAKEWPYKICLSYSKNGSHFVDFTRNKSSLSVINFEFDLGCFKTQRNKCCVFPFWYEGKQIYSCIKDNNIWPWCATTDNYTKDHLWDTCAGKSRTV